MDVESLPPMFPARPDPELSLRVARLRLDVARAAVAEAIVAGGTAERAKAVRLAMENCVKAIKALRKRAPEGAKNCAC